MTEKKSEFAVDPARICRSNGHKWKRPHPRSSFYDMKKNQQHRICKVCGIEEK